MSHSTANPYAHDTPEHMLWARWHRAFFEQPVHGQLMAIESHLRESLAALLHMSVGVYPPDVQRKMHAHLLEIEESVNLLNEAAEHAYFQVISRTPASLNGHRKP